MTLAAAAVTPLLASFLRGGLQEPVPETPKPPGSLTKVEPGVLRKVAGQDPWGAHQGQAAQVAQWELRLTDPDLAARERAFEELALAAASSPALTEVLREWALGKDELAWTARLALREVERARRSPVRTRALGPNLFGGADPFTEIERHMEQLFGGALHGGLGPRLRSSLPPSSSTARSVSIQRGADGVTVTVEETADGVTSKRTYTGKTLEEIQAANPDVDLVGHELFTFRLNFDGNDPFTRPRAPLPRGVRTDILGAYLKAVSDEHVGLEVDRVTPGTIAEALPLNPGDVLLRLNGVRLIEVDDVRLGLAARGEDGEVVVQLVDAAGDSHTRTWTPGKQ